MKMKIVNEMLCHETEFTLYSECDSSFSYGLQYTQNMLSQTCCTQQTKKDIAVGIVFFVV